jgi:hypothetical protein
VSSLPLKLAAWSVCPQCCRPHAGASCPVCQPDENAPRRRRDEPPELRPRQRTDEPLQERGRPANPEIGGLTLGALGLVPLLGLIFCVLGVVLSMAALRSARAVGRSPRVAYLALAVSLTTAVPGILLWGWLRAAAAAW